jgi:hypothetical protein
VQGHLPPIPHPILGLCCPGPGPSGLGVSSLAGERYVTMLQKNEVLLGPTMKRFSPFIQVWR